MYLHGVKFLLRTGSFHGETARSRRRSRLQTEQLARLRHCSTQQRRNTSFALLSGCIKALLSCITKSRRTRCTDCPIRISRNQIAVHSFRRGVTNRRGQECYQSKVPIMSDRRVTNRVITGRFHSDMPICRYGSDHRVQFAFKRIYFQNYTCVCTETQIS